MILRTIIVLLIMIGVTIIPWAIGHLYLGGLWPSLLLGDNVEKWMRGLGFLCTIIGTVIVVVVFSLLVFSYIKNGRATL